MEKVEKITTDKKEEKNNNVSKFGVTLLATVIGVAISFAILFCMQ